MDKESLPIEEKIAAIIHAGNGTVTSIMLWPNWDGGWLGALVDGKLQQVPGSVPWNPCPTIEAVLDSLHRAATILGRD